MSFGIFNSSTIPVLEQVVGFTQARHAVLAGNIANLDTPGYHVRDLSAQKFESRLREAIANRDFAVRGYDPASFAASYHDPVGAAGKNLEDLLYHDDSTGSLEKQIAAISKNQMQHNLAMSIMSSQFKLLQAAISERA